MERLCLACSKPIGSMRRSPYCSRSCHDEAVKARRNVGKEVPTAPTGSLIHSCHSADLNEPLPLKCSCRKRVNDDQLKQMIRDSEVIEIFGRPGEYCYTGRRKKTPRTPTIEKSHIERSVATGRPKERQLTQEQIDELLRERKERELAFDEEARVRWDVYAELSKQAWDAITVAVPEIHDQWSGRAIFVGLREDERSSVGKTVDREYVPEIFDEPETEGEIVERDDNTVSLDEAQIETGESEYAEQT